MIIYIHGFGSAGLGGKAKALKKYFHEQNIPYIAPSLSYVPELAISTLEDLIESYDDVTLIGSSLGGFYALYLAEKYAIKAVLINPAMHSDKTLKRSIDKEGLMTNYYDGSHFEWKATHMKMLEKYVIEEPTAAYLLLLQKGDEVLDYRHAMNILPHATQIVEEGGTHSFEGFERHFERIKHFLCK